VRCEAGDRALNQQVMLMPWVRAPGAGLRERQRPATCGHRSGAHHRRWGLQRYEFSRRAQPWFEAWIDGIRAHRAVW